MSNRISIGELRDLADRFVARRAQGRESWWRTPLLAAAPADRRFHRLPEIASPQHLLPRQLLPAARSVLVFFIPFLPRLLQENAPGPFPCPDWARAYEATNALIEGLSATLRDGLEERGFACAATPATHNFDEIQLMASWSHKHLGYLAGLGRFGVNAQLITPAGCGGRLGSLVTAAELGDHPLLGDRELCLHKAGAECLECMSRCPVGAVTLEGIDRRRCYGRLKTNLKHLSTQVPLQATTHVCGKCVAGLPCSVRAGGTAGAG